jgi:Phosphotransferase enzyme family
LRCNRCGCLRGGSSTSARADHSNLSFRHPQAPLRHLETGFGSIVVETSDGVIFRVARHEWAAAGHAREAKLLPVLRDRVPLAVRQPRWYLEPGTPSLAYGAIGYRRLPGTPLSPERAKELGRETLARQIAAFLLPLHRFPTEEAEALGVPHADRTSTA